jgi:DNA primase
VFMAKLNQSLLQQIQKNVSIVRLVQTKGVELIKQDKLWVGSCLFCKSQQSLKVNAFKNNWSCDECDASGDALDWVMKVDGVSKSHAAELLRNDLYLKVKDDEAKPVKHGTVKKLVDDIDSSLTGLEMLQQVMGFYHQTLLKSDEVMRFLETKKIASVELINHFKLGYANRSLSYRLPDKNRKAGKDIRTKLQSLGVMRSSGHEHLNGSLVIPIRDVNGICHDAYGRKILSNLRKGTPLDLYLGDPVIGVFNEVVFTHSKTIIFCLKPMDALTFWVNGVRNVSLIYGVDGLTGISSKLSNCMALRRWYWHSRKVLKRISTFNIVLMR